MGRVEGRPRGVHDDHLTQGAVGRCSDAVGSAPHLSARTAARNLSPALWVGRIDHGQSDLARGTGIRRSFNPAVANLCEPHPVLCRKRARKVSSLPMLTHDAPDISFMR